MITLSLLPSTSRDVKEFVRGQGHQDSRGYELRTLDIFPDPCKKLIVCVLVCLMSKKGSRKIHLSICLLTTLVEMNQKAGM